LFGLVVAEKLCASLGRNLCAPIDGSAQSRSLAEEHLRVTLSIALRWCAKLRLIFESSLWACPVYALDTRAWGSTSDFVSLIAPVDCSDAEAGAYRSLVRQCCSAAVVNAEIAKYSAWISIRKHRDLNQRVHFDFKELSSAVVFKQPGELLRALCLNSNDNLMVVVATPKGIRQMKAVQSPTDVHADALDAHADNYEVHYSDGFVTSLAAHPVLPVFISGSSVGTIELWHFSFPQPIKRYCALSSSSLCCIEFNATGSRFACGDAMGNTGALRGMTLCDGTHYMMRGNATHNMNDEQHRCVELRKFGVGNRSISAVPQPQQENHRGAVHRERRGLCDRWHL
jgi:hypothetical protein